MVQVQQTGTAGLAAAVRELAYARSEQAWERVLHAVGGDLLRVTRGILDDPALAEDAVQETLLQVRDHAGKFKPLPSDEDGSARKWIVRIAVNTALQMQRSRRRAAQREDDYARNSVVAVDDNGEVLRAVTEQLQALPDDQRVPIVLHYLGGLPYEDVAAELKCPVGTAKTNIHRGIERLKERLALLSVALPVPDLPAFLESLPSTQALLNAQQIAAWQSLLASTKVAALNSAAVAKGMSIMMKSVVGLSAAALITVAVVFMPNGQTEEKAAEKKDDKMTVTAQKITTFLMFEGKAEEAMNFYVSLFKNSKIEKITRYGKEGPGKEGSVIHASFTLNGQEFMAIDSPAKHAFTFTPSVSLYVKCDTKEEIDELFKKLSEGGAVMMPLDKYPFSERFGWAQDKFGVSWQLTLQK
jgi:RNA polymerase sigma factor (sigma-70 family)